MRLPEREHEEPCPSVFARERGAHHPVPALVHLRLFARRCRDDDADLDRRRGLQRADKAPHSRVALAKPVAIDEVLPDRHRIAPARERIHNQLAIEYALVWGNRAGSESADTGGVVAGFEGRGSVDTCPVVAGSGGHARGPRRRRRTGIPAALR